MTCWNLQKHNSWQTDNDIKPNMWKHFGFNTADRKIGIKTACSGLLNKIYYQ